MQPDLAVGLGLFYTVLGITWYKELGTPTPGPVHAILDLIISDITVCSCPGLLHLVIEESGYISPGHLEDVESITSL